MDYYKKLIESIQSSLQESITKKREYKGIEIDSGIDRVILPILILTPDQILHYKLDDLLSEDLFKIDDIFGEIKIFSTKKKGYQTEKVFLKDVHGQWDRNLETFNIIDFEIK